MTTKYSLQLLMALCLFPIIGCAEVHTETQEWDHDNGAKTIASYAQYLRNFPDGPHVGQAKTALVELVGAHLASAKRIRIRMVDQSISASGIDSGATKAQIVQTLRSQGYEPTDDNDPAGSAWGPDAPDTIVVFVAARNSEASNQQPAPSISISLRYFIGEVGQLFTVSYPYENMTAFRANMDLRPPLNVDGKTSWKLGGFSPAAYKVYARGLDYYLRGLVSDSSSDFDAAIVEYNQAIAMCPNFADAYNDRGLAKFWKRDFDGAIADCSRVIELNSIDPVANFHTVLQTRGDSRAARGDLDGAIADYTKGIEAADAVFLSDLYKRRSVARDRKGDHNGAIADAKKAAELKR